METIEISVIMPIYNPPIEYLKQALESMINQKAKSIELMLILDGSDQKTEQFCTRYQKKDNRIKIYRQENKGEGGARNTAIEKAQGKWITFLDSDDWLENNMVEIMQKQLNKITQHKNEIDLIIFDAYINYRNKEVKNKFYIKEGILDNVEIEEIQLQNIGQGVCQYYPKRCNVSVAWAKLYRRKFLLDNNLRFIERMKRYADTIFNIEVLEKAKKIAYCNKYIYHYRKNNYSITNNYYQEMKKDVDTFLNKVKEYILIYNKNQKFEKTYYIAILSKNIELLEMLYKKEKKITMLKEIANSYMKELTKINIMEKQHEIDINKYKKLILKAILNEDVTGVKNLISIKNTLKFIKKYQEKCNVKKKQNRCKENVNKKQKNTIEKNGKMI